MAIRKGGKKGVVLLIGRHIDKIRGYSTTFKWHSENFAVSTFSFLFFSRVCNGGASLV